MEEPDPNAIDPIWTTSRTARQIYALGQVEKVRSDDRGNERMKVKTFLLMDVGHYTIASTRSVVHIIVDVASNGWAER
jgi:hypothetical protein